MVPQPLTLNGTTTLNQAQHYLHEGGANLGLVQEGLHHQFPGPEGAAHAQVARRVARERLHCGLLHKRTFQGLGFRV